MGSRRGPRATEDLPLEWRAEPSAPWIRLSTWARNVEEGVENLTARVTVSAPGERVLRLFMVDRGIAVDRIVIEPGGPAGGYLARPGHSQRHSASDPCIRKRPWNAPASPSAGRRPCVRDVHRK
ncbi:hypothetical protein [Streptomyces sp. SID5643]|uniref:hypothetical protein n=1 Tax=Streptomyces sp. SID5643 TaxID=2690307 RepID=UPI0031FF3361